MILLRYLYILALVVWLGGMVVAGGVVAPSIFGVLEEWNPVEGRVLAGRVFGEVLQRLYWLGYAMAARDVRRADAPPAARARGPSSTACARRFSP